MTRRTWVFLWLCGALLAVTVVFMWAGSESIGRLSSQPRDNTTWIISQAEIELHRLRRVVGDYAAGRATAEDVALRVDVLASRVSLLNAPAVAPIIAEDLRLSARRAMTGLVDEADALLTASAPAGAWAALLPRIDAAGDEIHDLALHTVGVVAARSARDAVVLSRVDMASKSLALVLAVVMIAGLVWLLRQHAAMARMTRDLRQAAIRADQASRAKSAFLASMSHELRTPLNAIIGFTDLMRRGIWGPLGDSRYGEYCEHVSESGRHLLSLVNDVLDLAKVEAGRFEIHVEALDLAEQVTEAMAMVTPQADEMGVRVGSALGENLPRLQADERRFRQVLVNLLFNAVKVSPTGGEVRLEAAAAEGALRVAIIDEGPGMTPEDVERALEPFGQIGDSADLTVEGTGLGLPLSKALVEAQGGTLDIDSTVGEGTAVHLTFPVWQTMPEVRKSGGADAESAESSGRCAPVQG